MAEEDVRTEDATEQTRISVVRESASVVRVVVSDDADRHPLVAIGGTGCLDTAV